MSTMVNCDIGNAGSGSREMNEKQPRSHPSVVREKEQNAKLLCHRFRSLFSSYKSISRYVKILPCFHYVMEDLRPGSMTLKRLDNY